jgi:hypothetical protein
MMLPVALLNWVMRHQNITATMAYKAYLDSDRKSAALWKRFGRDESGGNPAGAARKRTSLYGRKWA